MSRIQDKLLDRKKAKVTKSSSRDGSEKVANVAASQTSDAAAASAPPPKVSSSQTTSVKLPVSIKAPVMHSLLEMIANPKGGGQVSKVSKASKNAPSEGSVGPVKNVSSSSADASQTGVSEKAKIKDKSLAITTPVLDAPGSKAKIQDKTPDKGLEASVEAQIQDKDMGEATISLMSPRDIVSPSRGGELFLHSIFETMQEEFLPFDVAFDSAKVTEGSSLACDEVPANTFVMSAQAVKPFVAAANRIRLPQVEDELVLQGGGTLYNLLLLPMPPFASTVKVKEKEEALALSEKRLADLSSEKETLSKSAANFETKVASLDKQVEELDAALAKARNDNEDLRGKVDVADQEFAALVEAERLRLSSVSGGSDALAKAVSDSFSFVSTSITPPSMVEALFKFSDHIDESFWSRVLAMGRQPRSEDSSDFSLSEFATPKPSSDVPLSKHATPESSSDISLSEFATPEPSSHGLAHHEPPIEIFSSPSEIHLLSDSDSLSPVEGGVDSFTFPPGSLMAVGKVYNYGSDASEGRGGRRKRGSRGRRSRGGPSSSQGSVRKKHGGQSHRSLRG
ncbi:hypothetical protein EJB05_47544, partial [Eragrostis curvula]